MFNTRIASGLIAPESGAPQGQVQLIDATQWFMLRKNLGKKNCELSMTISNASATHFSPSKTDFSNKALTIERPLRQVDVGEERRRALPPWSSSGRRSQSPSCSETLGPGPHTDFNAFFAAVERDTGARGETQHETKEAPPDQPREGAREVIARVHKPGRRSLPRCADSSAPRSTASPRSRRSQPTPNCAIPSKYRCSKRWYRSIYPA